jgi:hypothetical protein
MRVRTVLEALRPVELVRTTLTCRFAEPVPLHGYLGATLRGGLGWALKAVCCPAGCGPCERCLIRSSCAYAYIFETSPPDGAQALRLNSDVPRPFVLEPPPPTYEPIGELEFGLTLFGRGIVCLPVLILAFEHLGKTGLGPQRAKYQLERVQQLRGGGGGARTIYESGCGHLGPLGPPLSVADLLGEIEPPGGGGLSVEFTTPTRLKHGARYVESPQFQVLVRCLLRRISSIAYFHCGQALDLDYVGLIGRAAKVLLVEESIRQVSWSRFSRRQGQRVKMDGFVGWAKYAGEMEEFVPLVLLGQYTHVGKGAVFGLGRYRMQELAGLSANLIADRKMPGGSRKAVWRLKSGTFGGSERTWALQKGGFGGRFAEKGSKTPVRRGQIICGVATKAPMNRGLRVGRPPRLRWGMRSQRKPQ